MRGRVPERVRRRQQQLFGLVAGEPVAASHTTHGHAFDAADGRGGGLIEQTALATLVGQGPKLMSEIDMVGNDLGYSTGTCGKDGQGAPVADAQPTIRIPSVVVGGKLK